MVEAIMVEMKPKTHEKGKEMASARGPRSETCLNCNRSLIKMQ